MVIRKNKWIVNIILWGQEQHINYYVSDCTIQHVTPYIGKLYQQPLLKTTPFIWDSSQVAYIDEITPNYLDCLWPSGLPHTAIYGYTAFLSDGEGLSANTIAPLILCIFS